MKHIFVIIIVFISIGVLFHPGRTDEDGGHTDHSTGEYHYHHGYSAHQHPDGKCPYEDQEPIYTHHDSGYDNTASQNPSSTTLTSKSVDKAADYEQATNKENWRNRPLRWYEFLLIFAIPIGLFLILVAWVNVSEWIKRWKMKRISNK